MSEDKRNPTLVNQPRRRLLQVVGAAGAASALGMPSVSFGQASTRTVKIGLIQPMFVTRVQADKIRMTVTTLMVALLPSPGTLKALVFNGLLASDMRWLPMMDDGQHLFAHADKGWV